MNNDFNLLMIITPLALLAIIILIYFLVRPKKIIEKYDTGEVRKIYYTKKGNKVGVEKVYYRDGKINKVKKFTKGNQNGIEITYYPSGAEYIKANYIGGALTGEYKIFEEDGTIKEIKKY